MKIYLATDHAGYNLKEKIKSFLSEKDYSIEDLGAYEFNKDDDYPDFVSKAAEAVAKCGENSPSSPSSPSGQSQCRGIVIGGSGQGEAMVANRYKGVRAAVFYGPVKASSAIDVTGRESDDPYEMIKLPRAHENSNILSLGARFLSDDEAIKAVEVWLATEFSSEERHKRRIAKFF